MLNDYHSYLLQSTLTRNFYFKGLSFFFAALNPPREEYMDIVQVSILSHSPNNQLSYE